MTTPKPHADLPTNRLAQETSPYLLQHAHNPVDWYPWGTEALERAKVEDRPIFLSVGYSACHWCHVMERESFEDSEIADYLNANFVNIKVDREERPDVDQIYMNAVQAMTGHGGWPMSVFLTPEGKPFYGGTYFPPADRQGMPGFPRIVRAVADAWKNRRDEIAQGAAEMVAQIETLGRIQNDPNPLDVGLLDQAAVRLGRSFEPRHGGFGDAPKFPHPMDLRFLLRQHTRTGSGEALAMVRLTLDKMARGGIYDHLGGGFARYSTDARWLVPHFEKMLYDNALLSSTYLEAYQITGDPTYARVARETMDYVLGRMTGDEGQVYSTEDADSEGVEGKYYVWSLAEIESLLGAEQAKTFAAVYDVSATGNWEHANILNLPQPIKEAATALGRKADDLEAELAQSRAKLLQARASRIPPGKDTKAIAAWNGMMIAAWSVGWRVLDDSRYGDAATAAAHFLLSKLSAGDGRLLHVYKDGRAPVPGFLDDYACVIDGLTRLYEASGDPHWLREARRLAVRMIVDFRDPADNGFFYVASDHERLIVRTKDAIDNATPSGNAMAATALARLGALTFDTSFTEAAQGALQSARAVIDRYPTAAGQSLIALDFLLTETREIAVIGGDPAEWNAVLNRIAQEFTPSAVVAPSAQTPPSEEAVALVPWLEHRGSIGGRATTYVCRGRTCEAPVKGLEGVETALARL